MARYKIEWIFKKDCTNRHEGIHAVGGGEGLAGSWVMTEAEAIMRIQSGRDSFFTFVQRQVEVEVAGPPGAQYLRTIPDGTMVNNLLSLPCYKA